MKTDGTRIENLDANLSPLDAALLWLEDAHRFASLHDYAGWLARQTFDAYPLVRMPEQVKKAVSGALRGKPRDEVHASICQAQRDVLLLFYLHMRANTEVLRREEGLRLGAALLATALNRLIKDGALSADMASVRFRLTEALPYPLDPETAAAVRAAEEHAVETDESFPESDILQEWLTAAYLREGRSELPLGAYLTRAGTAAPFFPFEIPSPEDVRSRYPSEEAFQAFQDGRDYSYGLADVSDADYEARYQELQAAFAALRASGAVATGQSIRLDAVPFAYLQEVPLVEGSYVDAYVLALAEWGALLRRRGYDVQPPDDEHPLALPPILTPLAEAGEVSREVPQSELAPLLEKARQHLTAFPGRRQQIGGRLYLHLTDYAKWRGRGVKGKLMSSIQSGFLRESFNAWVDAQGGEGRALLASVHVERIPDHLGLFPVEECPTAAAAADEQESRRTMFGILQAWTVRGLDGQGAWAATRSWDSAPFRERVADWRQHARTLLFQVCRLRGAISQLGHRYFAGRELLFPQAAEFLRELEESVQDCVALYEEAIVADWERVTAFGAEGGDDWSRIGRLDLRAVRAEAEQSAADLAAQLLETAKLEALETQGDRLAVDALIKAQKARWLAN